MKNVNLFKRPMYGITRIFGNCWRVRLGTKLSKNGKPIPIVQKTFYDNNYENDKEKTLAAATIFRNREYKKLFKPKKIPKRKRKLHRITLDLKEFPNSSGLAGISIGYSEGEWGPKIHLRWVVTWSEKTIGGRIKKKSFWFHKHGGKFETFVVAAKFRKEKEIKLYGSTRIDLRKINFYYGIAIDEKRASVQAFG